MVRNIFGSPENRITETFMLTLHVHLTTDTPRFDLPLSIFLPLVGFKGKHFVKSSHVELRCVGSEFRFYGIISLILHFLSCTIVSVAVTLLDHLSHALYKLLKVIRGVGDLSWLYTEKI